MEPHGESAAALEHLTTSTTPRRRLSGISGVTAMSRHVGGKYEIERRLAVGGMGSLYVARHALTTERVALKVLDRALARDDVAIERFLREVSLAAKIGHPGLVRVFDAGIDVDDAGERAPYLAMELLSGETMAMRYARGDVRCAEALEHLVAALEPLVEVLDELDLARRLRRLAVRRDCDVVERERKVDRLREVGHEGTGALEDTDEVGFPAGVLGRDLLSHLQDAVLDLVEGK